jgi:hypothetical protein
MREWIIDPSILLDIGTSWRYVVSFTLRHFAPEERAPDTRRIGGWVGPRTGLDDVKRRKILSLQGIEL